MINTHGYAALEAKSELTPYDFSISDPASREVLIKVTHCGICHSDIHLIDDDWMIGAYPLVPGHEIIGIIEKVGTEVTAFKIGDRVGLGWQVGSCGTCEWCLKGQEQLCSSHKPTCVGRPGGFATRVMGHERFVFRIPEELSSEEAAPLLCGGITVYSPLVHHQVKPSDKVGVVGIGGLGHFAIQFAAKMGCEVTAFSRSPDKEAEARSFGARHFASGSTESELKSHYGSLDFIITTATGDLPWNEYIKCLRPNGKLVFVGATVNNMDLPPSLLLNGQKTVTASMIGSPALITQMLMFAARHHIRAKVETMPLEKVNIALDKVRQNKARYRMVLTF